MLRTRGILAAIACLSCWCNAATLDPDTLSIDEAIEAASTTQTRAGVLPESGIVKVELDILYTQAEYDLLYGPEGGQDVSRWKAMIDGRLRWTDAVVPYTFRTDFTESEMQSFHKALDEYRNYTCVSFRRATPEDSNYTYIQDGDGCSSYIGRRGGPQAITLASGCRSKGIIIHEFAHAIGFLHEQTRPDRDDHVLIVSENIQEGKEHNFRMRSFDEATTLGVDYDYLSVMHYSERAFSKNKEPTIVAMDPSYQKLMGNRRGFTFKDVKLVNLLYECAEKSSCPPLTCPGEGFVGKDCQCWCDSGDLDVPAVPCQAHDE